MSYLLDSHVLIWSIADTARLSPKAKDIISKENIYVSAASWWEISIKFKLGKLKLGDKTPEDFLQASQELEFKDLPLSEVETSSFHKLELLTKDPFDRMLVWQAIQHNLILISKDNRLSVYEKLGLKLLWL
ncbi:MAG: type II toxin-antitoxin system VapC family toxin [Cyclobacteriaceae bacterium]|nr:type II toxin-antitoxin system VapC family toxin [Cyclobacteriaceae bacterium]